MKRLPLSKQVQAPKIDGGRDMLLVIASILTITNCLVKYLFKKISKFPQP